MRVSLTEIKVRPGGKRVRLEQTVDVESLYIGRGPDNDLSLKGLTTSLHHATIRRGDGKVYIEAAQGQEVFINGLPTPGDRLSPGDEVHIGTWSLRLLDPEPGDDVRIEYEERQSDRNSRAALDARTHLGIERGFFARRPLSWIAIGGMLLGFLALPLIVPALRPLWTTGPVIRGHALIENDCASCHSGLFQPVSNTACTDCHVDVRRHAPATVAMERLDGLACADCHLEHRGREVALADQGATYCVTCHADLGTQLASSTLPDASDFETHHPEIRLAILEKPGEPPTRSTWPSEIEENPGVEFDHHLHTAQPLDGPEDEEWLDCGQCHQMEEDGHAMRPVRFDRNCRRCHPLDAGIPELSEAEAETLLIHGDPEPLRDRLRLYFTNQVLEGRVRDRDAPQALRRRAPGPLVSADERTQSARWIGARVAAADERLFDGDGCGLCHQVIGGRISNQTGAWQPRSVAPVQVPRRWIEHARFSHASHATQACSTCHPTAAVRDPDVDLEDEPTWAKASAIPYGLIDETPEITAAETSAEIMIPGIDTCRTCHVSLANAGGSKVASPCSACHNFHDHMLPPMIQAAEVAVEDDAEADEAVDTEES